MRDMLVAAGIDEDDIRSDASFDRFILFVVSFSRDLVGRALLEMKHECDA